MSHWKLPLMGGTTTKLLLSRGLPYVERGQRGEEGREKEGGEEGLGGGAGGAGGGVKAGGKI